MLRGEIRLVDLDPVRETEANKRRPAVIVSNDRANSIAACLGRGVITVVPVASNTDRIFPFQAFLAASDTGLHQDSSPRRAGPLNRGRAAGRCPRERASGYRTGLPPVG